MTGIYYFRGDRQRSEIGLLRKTLFILLWLGYRFVYGGGYTVDSTSSTAAVVLFYVGVSCPLFFESPMWDMQKAGFLLNLKPYTLKP